MPEVRTPATAPWGRRAAAAIASLGIGVGLAWGGGWIDPLRHLLGGSGALTVFIVLDTVRADHLSVCGYGRPTTPVLEGLVADGAALSCTAVAPGSWTLPSHASMFTGLEVPEHGAHALSVDPDVTPEAGQRSLGPARPLRDDVPTLAEQRPAVMVSANPVLGPSSGLDRGFRATRVADHFGDMYGEELVDAVRDVLRFEIQTGDLLFINIADAHQPWADVPAGLGWVPPRKAHRYKPARPRSLWRRFLEGERPEGYTDRMTDLYDHAVWRADRSVGRVLDLIAAYGYTVDRLVLTSDHGEHLGEHGLLGHGHYLWDENQVVPLLVTGVDLPAGPISATVAYDLVLGRPMAERPVRAAAWPHATKRVWFDDRLFSHTSARSWQPPQAWTTPEPVPEGAFGGWVEAVQASGVSRPEDGVDAGLGEQLKALGYF